MARQVVNRQGLPAKRRRAHCMRRRWYRSSKGEPLGLV